jgi:phage gpG-like protein
MASNHGFQAGINIRDGISPALAALTRHMRDKRPVLEAMGLAMVSLTQRAFTDESLRPSPWPARAGTKFGQRFSRSGKTIRTVLNSRSGAEEHQLLRKSGTLWHSIRISRLTNELVMVASDRKYAAVQQLGSKKKSGRGSGIPARPFFPFVGVGRMTDLGRQRVIGAAHVKLRALLRE